MKRLFSRLKRRKNGPPSTPPPPLTQRDDLTDSSNAQDLVSVIQGLVHSSLGGDAEALPPGVCETCFNLDPANDQYCEVGMADICSPDRRETLRSSTVSTHIHTIRSASRKCNYCTYLLRALLTFAPQCDTPQGFVTLYIMEDMPMTIEVFKDESLQQQHAEPEASIELYLQQPALPNTNTMHLRAVREGSQPDCLGLRRRVGALGYASDRTATADSQELFTFLNDCVDVCEMSHENCERRVQSLPDRVLRIDGDRITLQETANAVGKYLALSYCWGGDQDLKLTSTSRSELLSGMPVSSLPRLFRDVVRITKELKLNLIWIDALCIAQDDARDWEVQAGKMGDYYGHATVVLAAASAGSPTEGILEFRPTRYDSKVICRPDSGSFVIHARRDPWVFRGKGGDWNSPLLSRAWAYQERLLATRIITFGSGEVKFECRTHSRYEGQLHDAEGLPQLGFMRPHDHDPEMLALYEDWQQIVAGYSGLDLTFETDRLIAFSGIANAFARATGWIYRSGLWQQHLFRQLLWQIPEGHLQPRSLKHMAPTWSWASSNAQVSVFESMFSSISTSSPLLWDCNVAPGDGSVTGDHLTVTGILAPCALICRDPYNSTGNSHRLQCEGYRWDTYMWPDACLTPAKAALPVGYDMDATVRATNDEVQRGLQPFVGICYCLLLAKTDSVNPTCVGLVLGRSRLHENMFERIGLMADTNLGFFGDCAKAKRVTVEVV